MSSIPVFPSPIPAPGSQQDSFFSCPCPSEAGRGAKRPAAGRTTFRRFPFPPATHPTERQTEQFHPGAGQPPSAHTFGRLTLQCFHCLSTVPSSTWLTDPKLLGPSFSSSSSKMGPSPQISLANKNTSPRHRVSR